jgi:FtsH-binding integral membrane protein
MKEPKSQVIEMPNENLDAPKVSQDKDFYQKDGEYPVEIKTQEPGSHSDEGEEVSDSQIQMAVRAGFIRKVYGILSIQLLITFGAVFFCQIKPIKSLIFKNQALSGNLVVFSSLLFLVLFLCLACCRGLSRKVPYNYLFLLGITICEAIACAIASSIYSFQIVALALLLTIVATLAITFYACTTKNDFSTCRVGLYVIFSQMFTIGIIAVLFRIRALYAFYTFGMTGVVGIYLVYDTQLILGKLGVGYSVDDYIFATLEIYMDIIRLFLLILRILGNSSRRN